MNGLILLCAVVSQFTVEVVKPKANEQFAIEVVGGRSSTDDLLRTGCKLRPDLGSGVNTDYGVITCSHCIKSTTVQVECDGEVATGTVIARDAASDVALVSVPWKRVHPSVGIASANPSGSLQCVARSREGSLYVEQRTVRGSDSLGGMLLVDPPFISSQSGGGLIDSNGDLAGIVSGNVVDREPFRGLVIPADAIRSLVSPKAKSVASQAGQHSHLCRHCGTEFWHGAESAGSTQAHRCPNCGRVEWNVNRTAPGARLSMPVFKSRSTASCPSGQCPWAR